MGKNRLEAFSDGVIAIYWNKLQYGSYPSIATRWERA